MKVLITTGGSGGHIFPAMQVALQLKARGHQVVFAGSLSMAQEKLRAAGFNVIHIPAQGLNNRSPLGLLFFAGAMFKAVVMALMVLFRERPDKIIGFGGYGSFAMIAAAWVLRYSSMIHEQNVVPGKANRLMALLVKKIAISFKSSSAYFAAHKIVWTGCPCHSGAVNKSREELLRVFGLAGDDKVVLLLGGSQGSHRLNEVFFNMILREGKGLRVQAIHMTGQGEYERYRRQYQENQLTGMVYPFINNIEEAYCLADVVVARAGASTVCELGLLGKPCVLVPYPFAGNHQQFNAAVLLDAGAAVLLKEKDLDVAALKEAIIALLAKDGRLHANTAHLFNNNAAQDLAKVVEEL